MQLNKEPFWKLTNIQLLKVFHITGVARYSQTSSQKKANVEVYLYVLLSKFKVYRLLYRDLATCNLRLFLLKFPVGT